MTPKLPRLLGMCLWVWSGLLLTAGARAATRPTSATNSTSPTAGVTIGNALKQPDAWFTSAAGRTALANVLSHQTPRGDWPKNIRTAADRSTNTPGVVQGTFDNGATTGELRLLARAFRVTSGPEYRIAFLLGLDHVLQAQYTNGGWPQYSPPPARSYHRHITFNDGTMLRLIELTRDVAVSADFSFVDSPRRQAARRAFERGIDCVLRCQVVVHGRKTVWCAQHDEVTLEPRPGRSYELISLSGSESAGLLLFLMSLEAPSPAMIDAVTAGAAWFEQVQMTGVRELRVDGDKRLERDATAPPLWARFYELGSNRPFYCGRDGLKQYDIAAIESERRNGYAWHGPWGSPVRERFVRWKESPGRSPGSSPSSTLPP